MPTTESKEAVDKVVTRRTLLRVMGMGAAVTAATAALAGCGGSGSSSTTLGQSAPPNGDLTLLNAAATAEALASTMYVNIIESSLYTSGLSGNAPDQAYLVAAFEQEVDHYNLLVGAGGKPLATTFYFPNGMFGSGTANYQTTVNTLVTLEDAFIAAYLIAVDTFSTNGNKVLAAQILGVEAEHRALARVVTNDLGLTETTGLSGSPESVVAPSNTANNIAYERRFGLTSISQILTALTPFVTPPTGGSAFGTQAYPLVTTLPNGITPVNLSDNTPNS
jgi:hypothetical protein